MTWDNVEMIRNAQASAKARFEATALATQDEIQKVINSEAAKGITIPRLTEIEQMIFKMRSELIDYIVAHGLVDGLIWDGVLQPIQNGKIVITKEMIEILTEHLGYFTEADVQAFLEQYLPENHYVSDAAYVHTDNNYSTPEKQKLAGIEDGAEVNKIIDVIFNGVTVLDDGTRVATINITPEDIKRWYEENPDTNAFTDAQKAKLAGISDGAEVNRVDDVLVDGRSVLAEDKKAKITPEDIKKAYEKNPDTNAFTDMEKSDLAMLKAWKPEAEGDIANNAAEIAEAKQSISELGDEVNTVAGRVTTLETNTTQLRADVDAISEDAKAHLKRKGVIFPLDFAFPTGAGLYDATMKFNLHISYSTGTSTNLTAQIHGLVSASGTPIRLAGTLEGSQNAIYNPQLILTAGTSQGALLTVTYPSYDTNEEASVTAIECTETPVATYVKVDTGSAPTGGGLTVVANPKEADFAVVTLNEIENPDGISNLDVLTFSGTSWTPSTVAKVKTATIAPAIIGKRIMMPRCGDRHMGCFEVPYERQAPSQRDGGRGFFLQCQSLAKSDWDLIVLIGGVYTLGSDVQVIPNNQIRVAHGDAEDTYMTVEFYKIS